MATKTEILDAALVALRQGETLTLDSVAAHAGLTKPGIVHHFKTKGALTVAVVERLMDLWELDLNARVDDQADARARLRAYVEFAFTSDLDPSDLALLADARLRDKLNELWIERLRPWFGEDITADPVELASIRAARLLADGAWFDRALGTVDFSESDRFAILTIALELTEGTTRS